MCFTCILDTDQAFNHGTIRVTPLGKRIRSRFERGAMGDPGSQIELVCFKGSDDVVKINGQGITAREQGYFPAMKKRIREG